MNRMLDDATSFRSVFVSVALVAAVVARADEAADRQAPLTPEVLFHEAFDDDQLLARRWYDGDRFKISADNPHSGDGCLECRWKSRATGPYTTSPVRRIFEPTDKVYLRFFVRLSKDWGWTGRNYHPHLMHVMTTENGAYDGPAASHLTVYVEPQEGKLRLAAQDIQNHKAPHGLTQGPLKGGFNGMPYDSEETLFRDDEWHQVEATFQLNSLDLEADRPNADGVIRAWFDGELVIERTDIVLRSTDFPDMRFNQFFMAPYFGPGLLPHAQALWIDELTVATGRIEQE